MLKKMMFALMLGGILFTCLVVAQPQHPTKEQKLDFLSKKLVLNEQQVNAVDQILEGSKNQLDQRREKKQKLDKQMMKEMRQIFEKEDAQIEKNLTDSQRKIFAEIKKERENHHPLMGPPKGERNNIPQLPPPVR